MLHLKQCMYIQPWSRFACIFIYTDKMLGFQLCIHIYIWISRLQSCWALQLFLELGFQKNSFLIQAYKWSAGLECSCWTLNTWGVDVDLCTEGISSESITILNWWMMSYFHIWLYCVSVLLMVYVEFKFLLVGFCF